MPSTSRSLRAWLWRVKGRVQKYEVGLWFRKEKKKRVWKQDRLISGLELIAKVAGSTGLQVSR